jgi:hypothetical protein
MKYTLLIGMVVLGSVFGIAQEHQGHTPGSSAQKSMSSGMPDACKTMMAKRDQMMSRMKSMDAALDQKVGAMNAATGSAKVDAMANVINELVSQRKQMEQNMMTMHADMMQHMGSHMRAGKESMVNCPMMQDSASSKSAGH